MTHPAECLDLRAFAQQWTLDGDLITCRHCKRQMHPSWVLYGFTHDAACPSPGTEVNPWIALRDLINEQISAADHFGRIQP